MKLHKLLYLLLILVLAYNHFAQNDPPPTGAKIYTTQENQKRLEEQRRSAELKSNLEKDDDVIKVDTTLVQIDAVVMDKQGKIVSDLKADDFEILEDGKMQSIDFFSFVNGNSPTNTPLPKGSDNSKIPIPTTDLSSNQIKRTIAIVVDDSCMSFESSNATRVSLQRFVNEQIQAGDLVAIFRTKSGSGILQQFTTKKDILLKAIKTISTLPGLGCQDDFAAFRNQATLKRNGQGGASSFEDAQSEENRRRYERQRRDTSALGTVNTMKYLIRGMGNIPGRKSMILISDGLAASQNSIAGDEMRTLVNLANQAAVVINTVNARGVFDPTAFSAADEFLPNTGDGGYGSDLEKATASRQDTYNSGISGIRYLSTATGGRFVNNSNDLNKGFEKILNDQNGFYLLGYQPGDFTLKQTSNFRRLSVKVKNPDLIIRHRFGFYGSINPDKKLRKKSNESELYWALSSPVAEDKVQVKLTPFLGRNEKGGFLRYVLHIDAKELTFSDEKDNAKGLSLDVVAVTFGSDGKIADEFNRTHKVVVKNANLPQILKTGITYTGELAIKKAGTYQLRVAVRDNNSKNIGTASQFIESPNLKDENLAISQLIISGETEPFPPVLPSAKTAETALNFVESLTNPAVRVFKVGRALGYGYLINNPKLDSNKKPNLSSEARIYKDGELVAVVPETPIDSSTQTNTALIKDSGVIPIKSNMLIGAYILQVIVKDLNDKQKITTQWVDFEVTN